MTTTWVPPSGVCFCFWGALYGVMWELFREFRRWRTPRAGLARIRKRRSASDGIGGGTLQDCSGKVEDPLSGNGREALGIGVVANQPRSAVHLVD